MTTSIVEHVSARAALAGNPSDGYHGAVFAVPVDAHRAVAQLDPLEAGYEFVDALSGVTRFERWSDLERAFIALRARDRHCLQLGATASAAGRSGTLRPFRLRIDTTIPISVGLAGSSAIVIASLRSLLRWSGDAMDADELAVAALAVETQRLRIAAGLQDRVVQVHARPMLMRFDSDSTRAAPGAFVPVTPGRAFRLIVAAHPGRPESSAVVHGDLRARFETGDTVVRAAMPLLAQHAEEAAEAFRSGDVGRLGAAMDATFDVRASIIDLAGSHVAMVDDARAEGAHVNYTGSGGAIVALCPTSAIEDATRQSLKRLGCSIVSVDGTPESSTLDG